MSTGRSRILASLALLLLTGAAQGDAPVGAAKPVTFNIVAPTLVNALIEFTEQSGLQLAFPTAGSIDLPAPHVVGTLTPRDALERLLKGSGLVYEFTNERTVSVREGNTISAVKSAAESDVLQVAQAEVPSSSTGGAQGESRKESSGSRDPASEREISEIIVTATKRAENIRDVPISMTAITAAEMAERGFFNGEDYLRGLSSVSQVDTGGRARDVVIRGIGGFGGTTASYFGETPTNSGFDYEIKLVDVERVEVLRGPQGTALGSSSMGGTLRVIPKAPKLDSLSGNVSGSFSSTSGEGQENSGVQIVGNIPLVQDKLALRVVGYRHEDGGFYRNVAASDAAVRANIVTLYNVAESFVINKDNVGDFLVEGGRAAVLLQPTADLKFTVSYLSQKTQNDGLSISAGGPYQQNFLQVPPEHVIRGETGGVTDVSVDIANAMLEYDRGWASVVASYSHTDGTAQLVQPQQYFTRNWPVSYRQDDDKQADAAEVRLVSKFQGPINFITGLFYEDTESTTHYNYLWFGDPATNFFDSRPPAQRTRGMGDQTDRDALTQKAVFGEVSWKLLPGFTLTGGGRAFEYKRTTGPTDRSGIFGTNSPALASEDSGEIFRGNLSYKPSENTLLYAGISEGFRLGGPHVGLPTSCDRNGDGIADGTQISIASTKLIAADKLKSYELGVKFASEALRLSIDAALFRMDWTGLPVNAVAGTVATGCGFSYTANAGDARSEGFEIQANVRLTEAFSVGFGGSKIKAELIEDALPIGLKGDRLPGSPQTNANVGLRYEFGLAGHDAFVRADSIYVGEFFGNILQSPTLRGGDYVRHDVTAGVALRNFNVDLYVRNLTNENAFVGRGKFPEASATFGSQLRPRTIGLQVSYEFGK